MRKNQKTAFSIALASLMALNSLSYVGARIAWYAHGDVGAILQRVRSVDDTGVMNYFVAGNLNQPKKAFAFLEDMVEGGITYVNYATTTGCSMRQIIDQVLRDAKAQDCQVRVFAISMGERVARFVGAELTEAKTIAINPAPSPRILKPHVNIGVKIVAPMMEVLTVPLGWLSALPCIKGFSLACLADQWRDIAYSYDTPKPNHATIGVVCSSEDELLSNKEIADYYEGVPIVTIEGRHADTEGNAEAYAQALKQLLMTFG